MASFFEVDLDTLLYGTSEQILQFIPKASASDKLVSQSVQYNFEVNFLDLLKISKMTIKDYEQRVGYSFKNAHVFQDRISFSEAISIQEAAEAAKVLNISLEKLLKSPAGTFSVKQPRAKIKKTTLKPSLKSSIKQLLVKFVKDDKGSLDLDRIAGAFCESNPSKPKSDSEMLVDMKGPASKLQPGRLIAELDTITIFASQISRSESLYVIKQNLKKLSARHDVSHERLSVAIGMPADSVVKFFNDEVSPSIALLHNIARFYKTTMYTLMTCTEEFPSTTVDGTFVPITPKEQWTNYFENINGVLDQLGFVFKKFESVLHVKINKSPFAVINAFDALEIAEALDCSLEGLLDAPLDKSYTPRIRIIPPTISYYTLETNPSVIALRNNVITLAHHRGVCLEELSEKIGRKLPMIINFIRVKKTWERNIRFLYDLASFFDVEMDTLLYSTTEQILKLPVKPSAYNKKISENLHATFDVNFDDLLEKYEMTFEDYEARLGHPLPRLYDDMFKGSVTIQVAEELLKSLTFPWKSYLDHLEVPSPSVMRAVRSVRVPQRLNLH